MVPVNTAEGRVGAGLDGQAARRGSGLNWNLKGENGLEGGQEGHTQSLLECKGGPAGWQQDPWQVRGCGKPSHPAEMLSLRDHCGCTGGSVGVPSTPHSGGIILETLR